MVDINISRSGPFPALSNPFMMGPYGTSEQLRPLAVATHREWLDRRVVCASAMQGALPVGAKQRELTGEHTIAAITEILARHPIHTAFHLVCGPRCAGRLCHGHELARLFQMVAASSTEPPFPRELKVTVAEIMNDLSVLMYASHISGLPVIQIVSDVKDYFNQHMLSPSEMAKVGLITLDPRAVADRASELRTALPDLCCVAEGVLGYGLLNASNIGQRHAHLLTFVWMVHMLDESSSIVEALFVAHPRLRDWWRYREGLLEQRGGSRCELVRFKQARLWTISQYTDDCHQAILSIDLTLLALRVWRRITSELRLTMAIVQKHGLGQLVTVQGFRFHSGLGIVYVPEDKARRTLCDLEAAAADEMLLTDYRSLLGLLQSLMFVVGMRRSSAYGLYTPLAGRLSVAPDEMLRITPAIVEKLRAWRERLAQCGGAPFSAAVPDLSDSVLDRLRYAPLIFYLRTDACTTGTVRDRQVDPGLGGAIGGLVWRYALSPAEAELPIAVTEFAAVYGGLATQGRRVPTSALLLLEADALATVDTLAGDASRSPAMQLVHDRLLEHPQYVRLQRSMMVAQVHGPNNVMADYASRNNVQGLQAMAAQLGLALEFDTPAPELKRLMDQLLRLHRLDVPAISTSLPASAPPSPPESRPPSPPPAHTEPLSRRAPLRRCAGQAVRSRLLLCLGMLSPRTARAGWWTDMPPGAAPMESLSLQLPSVFPSAGMMPPPVSFESVGLPPPIVVTPAVMLPLLEPSLLTQPVVYPSVKLESEVWAPGAAARPSVAVPKPPPPSVASDLTAAHRVAKLLADDHTEFALRPSSFTLEELCSELYDPSAAQPVRTSKGQASAWKHWEAWCITNTTEPWRLLTNVAASERDTQREAVLQAGFLRFCHVRQSVRPRGGRKAALVSSAVKTLCHIRKMHKDRGYPMVPSHLVQTQVRRLQMEYKSKHGTKDFVARRREPFTRELLVNVLLGAPSGLSLGSFVLDWKSRAGRSLRGIITTLAQTGLRKGEIAVRSAGDPCDADCMSRGHLSWILRGRAYDPGCAPPELLANLQVGDFAVLTPCSSKADPFDMVWGGNPIYLPFTPGEPLCAAAALAAIELCDELPPNAEPLSVPLFASTSSGAFSDWELDRILRVLLRRVLPHETASLYSWHSARIFLATSLMEAGATDGQIQALCRWQTPQSIKIYGRLTANRYSELLGQALSAKITGARAGNLARALPFLDMSDLMRASAQRNAGAAAPTANDFDVHVHPDDDADEDDGEPGEEGNGADVHTPPTTPARPTTAATPRVAPTPSTPRARRPGVPRTPDDLTSGSEKPDDPAVAAVDARQLTGAQVRIPDRAWPEHADAPVRQMSTFEILGPLAADSNVYELRDVVYDHVYTLPYAEFARFLTKRLRALQSTSQRTAVRRGRHCLIKPPPKPPCV